MTLLGTYDAILFDMDGTLVDSTPAVNRSWAKWGVEYGFSADFRDKGPHGMPARDIVAALLPAEEAHQAYLRIQTIEVEEVSDVVALPGAASALAAIPAGRSAIVTSSSAPLAGARIEAAGITAPALVVTADDVENGKPNPEPYVTAAARLGFEPSRCLVVEDAGAGIEAGRAAGCATLALEGTTAVDELRAAGADAVAAGLHRVAFGVDADGRVRVELRRD